jgi:hypothetical protein
MPGFLELPALDASQSTPASGYQVEDQDDDRYYDQKVNEATANVQAEAEQP